MSLVTPELVGLDGGRLPRRKYDDVKVPNIRIVGPRLLVMPPRRVEARTDSGIVIPPSAAEDAQEAVVILVGDGTRVGGEVLKPVAEPGEVIIYARYAGIELELGGDKYLIIQESDVRAVLTYAGRVFTLEDEAS